MQGSDRFSSVPAAGALAAAGAIAFVLAFPPYDAWPLIVVAPMFLAVLAVRARSRRRVVAVVLAVQWAMWLWIDRWLLGVTGLGYPALALYMAAYPSAFVWLLHGVVRHRRLGRLPLALLVPVLWVGLEAFRGKLVMDGYGWYLVAHPLIGWPALVQSADLLGSYFPSFLVAALGGAVLDAIGLGGMGAGPARNRVVAPVAAGLLVALNLGYGLWRMDQTSSLVPGPTLLAIQTNLPQSNKMAWSPEAQRRDVASFIALTRRAFHASEGVDVIVWPETMLPARGLDPETLRTLGRWGETDEVDFARNVLDLSRELGVPLIVGAPVYVGLDVDLEAQRWIWSSHYNSAWLIDDGVPTSRYDKVFLTPFGEVMPYISRWPWLEEKLLGFGAGGMSFTLDAGPDIELLPLAWGGDDTPLGIATPICFEDAVPRVCRKMVYEGGDKRVAVLVNLSNDGWFADDDGVRAQHVQVARFRAIECRVPMVRCANTGLTVSIDSAGRIVGRAGPDGAGDRDAPRATGWLTTTVALDGRNTVYGRVGGVWPWTCLLATTVIAVWMAIDRRLSRRESRSRDLDAAKRKG